MTANSQLNSGKGVRRLVKRGFRPLKAKSRAKAKGLALPSPSISQDTVKRWFDIVFSFAVLVCCSPVYFLLMLLVALSSPGPIFYVQRRVGRHHRPFKCLKFRTMVHNADAVLQDLIATSPHLRAEFEDSFKLKHDPRITWIGHFLRVTSLDEFPQFWNVLKGDMSVVGPRPLVPEELPKYGHHINRILMIRPGITCIWQVSGRNDIPYDRRIQMDLHYVQARNLWLDLLLIFRTLGVVLFPKDNGAY
jgi:lipopolysaccharide/colanic/teichoic acid biosynthesis glycosyltransferase